MESYDMIIASDIGTASGIPNWPTTDIDGLFDAICRWPLDRRLDFSDDPAFSGRKGCAPFRGRAWSGKMAYDKESQRRVAVDINPIYPDRPDAVRFCGNFIGHSFGFWLDTDDADLIGRLDAAISLNLAKFVGQN
jgi:hypothetical protein